MPAKQTRNESADLGILLAFVRLCKHVFIFIALDVEMDPIDMAPAGYGLARRIGSNSVLNLESTGRRMKLAVPEAHQIFTAQGYFQLLSERVEQRQMEMLGKGD